jgi:hypothetical protein
MDLSSKEFTLNFRGFEQDDPETVKRFAAFCEANFALAPDTFGDAGSGAETIVLTQGKSPEALEALAKVLREIGAHVDVCEECRLDEHTKLVGPSTQELHRLFEHQLDNDPANSDGPSCPYPPLGRTLYLLNRTDSVFDRRTLRTKTPRSQESHEISTVARQRRTAFVALSIISLTVGALVLIATAVLLQRGPLLVSEREQRSSFQTREHSQKTRTDSAVNDLQSTRGLNAATRVSGFNVELKVVTSPRSLSISALTIVPAAENRMSDGSMIKRIVGDPAFLAESSKGTWTGSIRLSVFVDIQGEESHLTIPAKISVSVTNDHSAGQAVIEIINEPANDTAQELSMQGSQAATHLRNVTLSNIPLFKGDKAKPR